VDGATCCTQKRAMLVTADVAELCSNDEATKIETMPQEIENRDQPPSCFSWRFSRMN